MSAQDVMRNFMSVLDNTSNQGVPALDEAVAAVSKFQSWTQLVKTMAADCAAYGTNGKGFLSDMCGIVLDNEDTGAISGSDAGGSVTKTAESIVPETGSWTYPSSGTFTINGLTVNIDNFENLDTAEQWITGALYTWWIRESLSLINSSYGFSFNEAGTSVKTLTVQFYNAADGKMASSLYSNGQKSTELYLRINMNYFGSIDTTNPNGVTPATSGALNSLDRTIAHELVHAVMSANVDWYANLPTYFKEGSAELVHGIDDKRYATIQALSTNSASLESAALSGSGVESYAAGYIALRYLAKQANEGRDPSTAVVPDTSTVTDTSTATNTATTDTSIVDTATSAITNISATSNMTFDGVTMKITGATNSDVWLGGVNPFTGAANAYGNATAIVLDATEMTDAHFLGGNTNDNQILAGLAGSTMWGGALGNDILAGGAGRDNFWYLLGGGQDTAVNFATGSAGDVLSFVSGGVTGILRDGNVLAALMADGGSFTAITDDATAANTVNYSVDGTNILFAKIGNTYVENNFAYEGDGVSYLGGLAVDTINILTPNTSVNLANGNFSSIEVLNAINSGGGGTLFGDAAANQIYSGGNGSVLWGGGIADDILQGAGGVDIFLYGRGEGNDVIVNVGDDDTVNLYNATLADITFEQETESGMLIGVGSNVLSIVGTNNTTVAFADGLTVRYNRAAKVWTTT